MRLKRTILLTIAGALAIAASVTSLRAQEPEPSSKGVTFYVNKKTGQVFVRPGRGRAPMTFYPGVDEDAIQRRVEQKTHDQLRAAIAETQAQERVDTADVQKQIADIKPAWKSYMDNFQNKFRIGTLVYMDYSMYTHTGFGPQQLENTNPPGPGNNEFNAFDITRVYLNTYFFPTDNWTFRFTPEIYRANGAQSNATTKDTFGKSTAVGSNLDGELNLRLKYAYVQYKGLLDSLGPELKGANITFGAQPNPFIPWEEDLYQFRYVNLVPWNYLGFSSSQIGLQVDGPFKPFGGEATYLEYGLGVYDEGNFRTQEQTNTKQVMARGTLYPFGANWRFQGLGLTGFWNYGWGNQTPDFQGRTETLKSDRANFERVAALIHYSSEQWGLAGEFDYGKNAFLLNNLFSGSGPLDAFGTPSGVALTSGTHFGNTCTAAAPCYNVFNTFGPATAVYQALLNNGRERNVGWDVFGHFHIPGTKLTAFGMFQWLLPNDNISKDPLDFQRFIAGVSYQYNEYLRFALDSQNLLFYHNQFGITPKQASTFGFVPGSTFNGWKLPKTITTPGSLNGTIPFLVPRDQHAIFFNVEFAY
jgi:hypothetical protein